MAQDVTRRRSARLRFLALFSIALLLAPVAVPGQSPALFPQTQTKSDQSGSLYGGQAGQQACSPAEFGDPNADCMPFNRQTGYSYGQAGSSPYADYTGMDPLLTSGSPMRAPMTDSQQERTNSSAEMQPAARPVPVEKEPPTEFQRYVAAATGQMLPIFGASLFEHVPVTFAPLDHNPVGAEYRIAPGDELQVAVWGQFNLSRRLIVDRSGQIILPEGGPVNVSGLSYSQASSVVKASLSHLYRNFDVSVSLLRLHSIQIFVVGEARRPGSYNVSSMSTLVNAIFASGGPSSRGSMRNIQLKRGGREVCAFDLYDFLVNGDKSKDEQLAPGDVIFIPPAGPRVALAGSIEHPAIYEIETGTNLGKALRIADGLSPLAATKQAVVERVADGSGLETLRVSMNSQGLRTELQNGDVIRVSPIVPRFQGTVTVRGNVADPGRFPWKQGMHLSDLIPNKDSLLTRDYWKARNALGNPEFRELADASEGAQTPSGTVGGAPGSAAQEGTAASDIGTRPVSYRDQKRNTQGDSSLAAATETDNVPPLRTFTPRFNVQPSVPEINWEYAVIERTDPVTLATRAIPFNLGKLVLSQDESQNLALIPGDIVTIFSKADFSIPHSQQLTQIRIEGEVAMAGVYTVHPGQTLRNVLSEAGGLTSNAYLYGAQFTRESTRREQQKRFDDFLNQMEREMNESASSLSSRVTSTQEAATAQTSLASQRDLIERLRKISMNGRIVLNVNPQSREASSIPDLALENGDRLYVPTRPATVNVIGTVYEQASFLHEPDYRTGDYLEKAGGPARSADRSHMFIIRADGSVISRHSNSPFFAKSFDSLPMYPGDTLVVPTYFNRSTFVRSLLDWSQIMSSFGLGAAAINVLR